MSSTYLSLSLSSDRSKVAGIIWVGEINKKSPTSENMGDYDADACLLFYVKN